MLQREDSVVGGIFRDALRMSPCECLSVDVVHKFIFGYLSLSGASSILESVFLLKNPKQFGKADDLRDKTQQGMLLCCYNYIFLFISIFLMDKSKGNPLEFMDYSTGHCGNSWGGILGV